MTTTSEIHSDVLNSLGSALSDCFPAEEIEYSFAECLREDLSLRFDLTEASTDQLEDLEYEIGELADMIIGYIYEVMQSAVQQTKLSDGPLEAYYETFLASIEDILGK